MSVGYKIGTTYYSEFKNIRSITNPVMDNNVHMKYRGFFSSDWDNFSLDFDNFGYGMKKTVANQGCIFCDDASKLFTIQRGYVGILLKIPLPIIDGIYQAVSNQSLNNDYILFGVNTGQSGISLPGVYAALTSAGIRFEIWSSAGRFFIVDQYSNISSGTVLFEFLWDNNGIDDFNLNDFKSTMCIRINEQEIVLGNAPIVNDSLSNINFYVLDTPFTTSNMECTIKRLMIANELPEKIKNIWQSSSSSSSSSSSFSSSSSSIDSSSSSSSSIDSSSSLSSMNSIVSSSTSSSSFIDYIWTERRPAGDVDKNWISVASDNDGSSLIAGEYIGRLYTSTDGGINWAERRPAGDVDKTWISVASNFYGSSLIAASYKERLYTSIDGGINWTERRPAGDVDKDWYCVDSDITGDKLIVAAAGDRLYTSIDGGINWTERRPAGDVDKDWLCVASNEDGSCLIVAASPGRMYTSTDGGANWTERRPAGDVDKNWWRVVSNEDGSCLFAAVYAGRLYTSTDGGINWAERRPAGDVDKEWYDIAIDASGDILVAGGWSMGMYISSSGGVSWREIAPAGYNYHWVAIASNNDGSNLIAGRFLGRLYTGSI